MAKEGNKIIEIIEKLNLMDSKPCNTPMEPDYLKFVDDDNLLPDNNKYFQAMGELLYISSVTRPDISVAINTLSRRNENRRDKDRNANKRVTKYLKITKDLKKNK